MGRTLALVYGLLVYTVFFGTFVYLIGFLGGFGVPRSVDIGPLEPPRRAALVDLLLLGVFAAQHSVMARAWFKRRWTRIVPPAAERSTYVLAASLALLLLYSQWRPIPTPVWTAEAAAGAALLRGLFWAGWGIVGLSTFLIDHFDLFGVRQVWLHFRRREYEPPPLRSPLLYRLLRHPLYLGFLLASWAAPVMTAGHLLFACGTTAYILVGIRLEERDLVREHGEAYVRYRRRVRMLVPVPRRKG